MKKIVAALKKMINALPWIRRRATHRASISVPESDRITRINLTQRPLSLRAAGRRMLKQPEYFENRGYCYCCKSMVKFVAHGGWWRDQYVCTNCRCLPRERAIMYCLDNLFPRWPAQTIHESSPGKRGASLRLKAECPGYEASQYYPGVATGTIHQGFRCENLEALTFEDARFDLHVTQDVFEHVLDPAKAFAEIARTLKPGGAHVFTTPLENKDMPSEIQARRAPDGSIMSGTSKSQYHGNPISPDGSLVTMHWGYDIGEFIFRASGLFTTIVLIDAIDLGIHADLIEVLITRKPPRGFPAGESAETIVGRESEQPRP